MDSSAVESSMEQAPAASSPPPSTFAATPQEAASNAPPRDPSPQPPQEKVRYKSWRKKYRKMKHHFDDRMEDANELFLSNWRAEQIARRIKEQNDQLLEILLDVNDLRELPPSKRLDLELCDLHDAAQAPTPQSPGNMKPGGGTKLSALEAAANFTSRLGLSQSLMPLDLQTTNHPPPGYMTPSHEDEYLGIMDEALEALPLPNLDMPSKPTGNAVLDQNVDIRPRRYDPPTERDFAERSSVSVYNWIKQHQPGIHADKADKGGKDGADSDRARSPALATPGTAGSKRKAKEKLKKEDVPFETLDDEIGFDAADEPTFGTSRNKRKKDDEAYRPKGGKSRPVKRKRDRDDAGGMEGDITPGPKKVKKGSVDESAD